MILLQVTHKFSDRSVIVRKELINAHIEDPLSNDCIKPLGASQMSQCPTASLVNLEVAENVAECEDLMKCEADLREQQNMKLAFLLIAVSVAASLELFWSLFEAPIGYVQ